MSRVSRLWQCTEPLCVKLCTKYYKTPTPFNASSRIRVCLHGRLSIGKIHHISMAEIRADFCHGLSFCNVHFTTDYPHSMGLILILSADVVIHTKQVTCHLLFPRHGLKNVQSYKLRTGFPLNILSIFSWNSRRFYCGMYTDSTPNFIRISAVQGFRVRYSSLQLPKKRQQDLHRMYTQFGHFAVQVQLLNVP